MCPQINGYLEVRVFDGIGTREFPQSSASRSKSWSWMLGTRGDISGVVYRESWEIHVELVNVELLK
jgi:hypothetical protein